MASQKRTSKYLRQSLLTGAAYGIGLAVGSMVSSFLFQVLSPDAYGSLGEAARLIIGVLLVIVILSTGGGIGGFLGGWTLPVVGRPRGRFGYAWRSTITLGLAYSTFLFLAVLGISLLTMTDAAFLPASDFAYVYAVVGAIFGVLFGLLLGLSTVGWRRTGSVVLAAVLGFALGGAGLGVGIWGYLVSAPPGGVDDGFYPLLLLGILIFGFLGGVALGPAYHRLARRESGTVPSPPRRRATFVWYIVIAVALVLGFYALRPVLQGLAGVLTPRAAKYADVIESDAIGTHWQPQADPHVGGLESGTSTLDLAASPAGEVAIVWLAMAGESSGPMLLTGHIEPHGSFIWDNQIAVSRSAAGSIKPQVAVDPIGRVHVAWLEEAPVSVLAYHSICEGDACSDPVPLHDPDILCGRGGDSVSGVGPSSLDIAVNPEGMLMTVWRDEAGGLQYSTLPQSTAGGNLDRGCVPLPGDVRVRALALTSGPGTDFSLSFDEGTEPEGQVWLTTFQNGRWDENPQRLGTGHQPAIWVDDGQGAHVVWCGQGTGVNVSRDGEIEVVTDLPCKGKPAIALDEEGRYHVLWYSDLVKDLYGGLAQDDVLYESIRLEDGWSTPAIVARPAQPAGYAMTAGPEGLLHLVWGVRGDSRPAIQHALQSQYGCDESLLSGAERTMYSVARDGGYRSQDGLIPFCRNRYEMMVFTPNTDPAFSDRPPTANGAYDDYAKLAKAAEFEVLFTTMAYKDAKNHDSPGAVFADAVAELYRQLKEEPEQYPRGLLVRILLGNSPPITSLELDSQLWLVLKDLQEAGIDRMADPDLGWKLEVANYSGAWPHSHVKTMIVDGKTVIASGFNHEYKPLPKDHPSGQGLGDADVGIVVTGPVAQHTRRIYDELWEGSVQRHCNDLTVDRRLLRFACKDTRGEPSHVPEVMRYYPTEDDSVVFSMFRNRVYDEADRQIIETFASASDSIEIAQAMFSMPLICNLNYFYEVCSFDQAPSYMKSLMHAAENGARISILLMPYPIQSVENVIAMEIFSTEARSRGLEDRVELRFFDDLLHAKSALVDGAFLIIGSQNLHHSAFGTGKGLAEYSLGTSDPAAIAQFRRMFEHYWERGWAPAAPP